MHIHNLRVQLSDGTHNFQKDSKLGPKLDMGAAAPADSSERRLGDAAMLAMNEPEMRIPGTNDTEPLSFPCHGSDGGPRIRLKRLVRKRY